MAPSGKGGGGAPRGPIGELIDKSFGSFDQFKQAFNEAAASHFGSGWCWLVQPVGQQKLAVMTTHDAGNPLREGAVPILACDLWEHAYYLDVQNEKKKYLEAWWHLVNWDFANKNLGAKNLNQITQHGLVREQE